MAFRTHVLNFKEFYARGDGVTDDTAYVNNASANLSDAGGVGSTSPQAPKRPGILLRSNVTFLFAAGAVLKLGDGANADLLTDGNASLIDVQAPTGTGSSGGSKGWGLVNATLDGNKANNPTGDWCLRAYGYRFLLRDVLVHNGKGGGCQLDWNGGQSFDSDGPEGTIDGLSVHDCDGIGLQIGSPHHTRLAERQRRQRHADAGGVVKSNVTFAEAGVSNAANNRYHGAAPPRAAGRK